VLLQQSFPHFPCPPAPQCAWRPSPLGDTKYKKLSPWFQPQGVFEGENRRLDTSLFPFSYCFSYCFVKNFPTTIPTTEAENRPKMTNLQENHI
jgi:hypothetical protein